MAINKIRIENSEDIYYIGKQIKDTDSIEIPYEWEELHEMLSEGNFGVLKCGDYKTISFNDEDCKCAIVNMDYCPFSSCYYLDFCVLGAGLTYTWSENENNNGESDEQSNPYLYSNLYNELATFSSIDSDIWDYMIDKIDYAEARYSEDGLTASTGIVTEVDLGQIWIPSEYELFGSSNLGSNFDSGICKQLDFSKVELESTWLRTLSKNDSENALYFNGTSIEKKAIAETASILPCFRFA